MRARHYGDVLGARPAIGWVEVHSENYFGAGGYAVYRGNAFGNWAQALAGAYPIVRKIVGEEFFDGLARAYAIEHRSASGDLNEYGAELAEFAAAFAHTQDLPYLPDVARMEWLAHRAYYAANAKSFDFELLKTSSPGTLRLALAPACALLASDWPLAPASGPSTRTTTKARSRSISARHPTGFSCTVRAGAHWCARSRRAITVF